MTDDPSTKHPSNDGFEPRATPWQAAALEAAPGAPFDEAARAFVQAAVLAPSGHNTQPWRFAIREPDVVVSPDPERRLPIADPDDRELTMSLGAAVMNLCVAAARAGYRSTVAAGGGEEMARVRLEAGGAEAGLAALFPALTERRTWRLAFSPAGLPAEAWEALRGVGPLGDAHVLLVEDDRRDVLVDLIAEGDHARMSDKAFRAELASWMRPAHTGAPDGLAGDALGLSPFASDMAAWSTKAFDMGRSVAKKDAALATDSAALVVIAAPDERAALIDAGRLLEQFLLTATLHGVSASFFNLPVEVPALRGRIQEVLDTEHRPQLLFRIGVAGAAQLRHSARRPLADVLAA